MNIEETHDSEAKTEEPYYDTVKSEDLQSRSKDQMRALLKTNNAYEIPLKDQC